MEVVQIGKEDNAVILAVKGKIDAVSAPEFEEKLGEWIEKGEINLILDFTDLDYISSAGLRSILATAKRLKAGAGQILLSSMKDAVKEVFEISGFSSIIPIHESAEKALANMQ